MAKSFAAYFTLKDAWRSADVVELGTYSTEQAAMQCAQRSAIQHPEWDKRAPRRLTWTRMRWGLIAKTRFGRYDIREVAG